MRKFHFFACLCLCTGLLVSCGKTDFPSGSATTNTDMTTTTTTLKESTNVTVKIDTNATNPETMSETASTSSSAPAEKETENKNLSEQLQILIDNREMWMDEFTPYNYAVTDFNQDGRMEIVCSVCNGTGIYTTTYIYEIDEADSSLIKYERTLNEYDSEADLIVEKASVYFDKERNSYHYVFDDLSKNGMAEYYENKRDWYLQDGKIIENYLAFKTTIYQDAGASMSVTCEDASREKEITEEEYANIANVVFSDLKKMEVSIHWITKDATELKNTSDSDLFQILSESWEGFQIQ